MWQRRGTDRPDLDGSAALQAFERIRLTVAVEVAYELRVGVTELERS